MNYKFNNQHYPCILCNSSTESKLLYKGKGFKGDFISVMICKNDGLVFLNPRPSEADYNYYYEELYGINYFQKKEIKIKDNSKNAILLLNRINRLKEFDFSNVLEVGAGEGKEKGFEGGAVKVARLTIEQAYAKYTKAKKIDGLRSSTLERSRYAMKSLYKVIGRSGSILERFLNISDNNLGLTSLNSVSEIFCSISNFNFSKIPNVYIRNISILSRLGSMSLKGW